MKRKLAYLLAILILVSLAFLLYGLKASTAGYVMSRRIPALAAMIITGAAIAASSVVFQTITNNRILTPSILGLDSLYSLIQTLWMFFPLLWSGSAANSVNSSLPDFALSVTVMAGFSVLVLGSFLKILKGDVPKLLLSGIITGTLFRSTSSFLQVLMDPNEYLVLQSKLFASFNNIPAELIIPSAVLLVITIILMLLKAPELDVLNLGKNQAVELGLSYDRLVRYGLIGCSILVAISTALVGPITFLGILVSNLARELMPTYKHEQLLPSSMLIGAITIVLGQFLTASLLRLETPVSVVINFIGGIYFIYLLLKGSQL